MLVRNLITIWMCILGLLFAGPTVSLVPSNMDPVDFAYCGKNDSFPFELLDVRMIGEIQPVEENKEFTIEIVIRSRLSRNLNKIPFMYAIHYNLKTHPIGSVQRFDLCHLPHFCPLKKGDVRTFRTTILTKPDFHTPKITAPDVTILDSFSNTLLCFRPLVRIIDHDYRHYKVDLDLNE